MGRIKGVGAIILLDGKNCIMLAGSTFSKAEDPLHAELLAMEFGLKVSKEKGIPVDILSCDSQVLVNLVKRNKYLVHLFSIM